MHARIVELTLAAAALLAGGQRAPAQETGCRGQIEAELGFSSLTFSQGRTMIGKNGEFTLFGTEPILSGIDRGGVAAGRLEEGDALVAVDGQLITTRAGALRYAGIRPGIPVLLTVRRGGRNLEVRIVPGSQCVPDVPDIPEVPDVPATPDPPRISAGRGLLGMGISCNCTLQQDPRRGDVWTFREPPRVEAVAAGGAAQRAGLLPGDRIDRIDGAPTTSADGGRRFGAIKPGQRVRLDVLRGATRIQLVLVAEKP